MTFQRIFVHQTVCECECREDEDKDDGMGNYRSNLLRKKVRSNGSLTNTRTLQFLHGSKTISVTLNSSMSVRDLERTLLTIQQDLQIPLGSSLCGFLTGEVMTA